MKPETLDKAIERIREAETRGDKYFRLYNDTVRELAEWKIRAVNAEAKLEQLGRGEG